MSGRAGFLFSAGETEARRDTRHSGGHWAGNTELGTLSGGHRTRGHHHSVAFGAVSPAEPLIPQCPEPPWAPLPANRP